MREKRSVSAILMLGSLLLVGAGCGQGASVSTPVDTSGKPTAKQEQPAPAPTPVVDSCGNPYYPFKAGFAATYGVTTSPKASALHDYTIRVLSVEGTVATIRTEMAGGITADVTADCANGAVAIKGDINPGTLAQGMKVKTTVLSSSGTYLPSNISVGTSWESAIKVSLEMTEGPGAGMGPMTSSSTTTSKAVANESVTVPAGTYEAVKVEVTRTTTTEMPSSLPDGVKLPPGMKMPTVPPTTTTSTEWWVKGIGMVKSVMTVNGQTTTVEAKSVSGM